MTISKIKAKVHWFDIRSGDGMIRLNDGSCVYVHWSAIANGLNTELEEPFKNVKKVWCVLFKGQDVLVDIFHDSLYRQVSKVY